VTNCFFVNTHPSKRKGNLGAKLIFFVKHSIAAPVHYGAWLDLIRGLLNISLTWRAKARHGADTSSRRECSKPVLRLLEGKSVQPCPEGVDGKAAAILTRGAYMEYVSTAKWRPACAKPLRRRQGTPLAAFCNIPRR